MSYSFNDIVYDCTIKQFVNVGGCKHEPIIIHPRLVNAVSVLISSRTAFVYVYHTNTFLFYSRNRLWALNWTGDGSLISRPLMNTEHAQYFTGARFGVSINYRYAYAWQSGNHVYVDRHDSPYAPFIVQVPDDYVVEDLAFGTDYMIHQIVRNITTSERYKTVILDSRHCKFGAISTYCYKVPEEGVVCRRGEVYRADGTRIPITYEHKVRSFVEII